MTADELEAGSGDAKPLRFAIADPPYLGRAVRWYGGGPGNYDGKGSTDNHPEAAVWDTPERHEQLVAELVRDFDGWAIAMAPDNLVDYMAWVPRDTRVAVWYRRNAAPSASRVRCAWEPVLVFIPPARRGRAWDRADDVAEISVPHVGFTGSKPAAWSRWVLTMLGVGPLDEVVDLFHGSGAVAAEVAQGRLV